MTSKATVLDFIKLFQSDKTVKMFTSGLCYWFAHILKNRFKGTVMYDIAENHFTCRIGRALYDITGEVTAKYIKSVEWDGWNADLIHKKRIVRDCILKERII